MVKKKEVIAKSRCKGSGIIGHIVLLAGMYVLTWGLIDSVAIGDVLKSPIFWGLFLIFGGLCSMAQKHKA